MKGIGQCPILPLQYRIIFLGNKISGNCYFAFNAAANTASTVPLNEVRLISWPCVPHISRPEQLSSPPPGLQPAPWRQPRRAVPPPWPPPPVRPRSARPLPPWRLFVPRNGPPWHRRSLSKQLAWQRIQDHPRWDERGNAPATLAWRRRRRLTDRQNWCGHGQALKTESVSRSALPANTADTLGGQPVPTATDHSSPWLPQVPPRQNRGRFLPRARVAPAV
jgi:hypothetical protein